MANSTNAKALRAFIRSQRNLIHEMETSLNAADIALDDVEDIDTELEYRRSGLGSRLVRTEHTDKLKCGLAERRAKVKASMVQYATAGHKMFTEIQEAEAS